MTLTTIFNQKGTWQVVYILGIHMPVWNTASTFGSSVVEKIPLAMIALVISSLVAFGIYSLVRSTSHLTKSLVLLATVIVISMLSAPFEAFAQTLKYETCEVCGFVSVDKKAFECQVCASRKWNNSLNMDGYNDRAEYVRDEQLFWFHTESSGEKVNFHLPEGEKNELKFAKDKDWEPSVTAEEVIEYSKAGWKD